MSMPRVFLTAQWRHLLMLNYTIDPDALRPLVPAGTQLDTWNGQTFISLVGFRFLQTKILGWSIPFHRDFDEVNLRFYVRREVDGETRRGVVFVKEIVPRLAIAAVARWLYNENYVALPMKSRIEVPGNDSSTGSVQYGWTARRIQYAVAAETQGSSYLPTANSEQEFITEHYWGYSAGRNALTVEYQVEHPQWRVWQAINATAHGDFETFYGPEFAEAIARQPTSAFIAEGSEVLVRKGRRLSE